MHGKLPHKRALKPMPFKTKLFFITLLPVLLILAATLLVINFQSSRLAQSQADIVETLYLDLKHTELKNYVMLARNALTPIYGSTLKTKRRAQREVMEIVRKMTFGEDSYFFIYEEDGTNIVNPRLTYLVGSNWIGLEDRDGRQVVKNLIDGPKAAASSIPISGKTVERRICRKARLFDLSRQVGLDAGDRHLSRRRFATGASGPA